MGTHRANRILRLGGFYAEKHLFFALCVGFAASSRLLHT